MSDRPTPPTPPTPPTQPPQPHVGYPPAGEPVQTGMAVAALVLGIAGLTVCPMVGAIAAIVLGIVALSRISNEPQRYGGRGMATGGLVCGVVGVVMIPIMALMLVIVLPPLLRARGLSKRLACASNMAGIGTTIRTYTNEHQGEGVPTLDWMVEQGMLTEKQLICPSSGLETSNYIHVSFPGGPVDNRAVAMYEPKSNHGDKGGNFLFADGHATFIRVPEYDRLIEGTSDD